MQDGGPGKSSYHFYSFKSSHHTYSDIQLYWPPEENFNKVWGHFLLRKFVYIARTKYVGAKLSYYPNSDSCFQLARIATRGDV